MESHKDIADNALDSSISTQAELSVDINNENFFEGEIGTTPRLLPNELIPYQDDLPVPLTYDLRESGSVVYQKVTLQSSCVRFSKQLGSTRAWTYDGTVPGPSFIVNQGQVVHVDWYNGINKDTPLPYRVAVCPDPQQDEPIPQNVPGLDETAEVNCQAADLHAATVTHLHGGRTAADSDGWTENVALHNQSQRTTYENNQRSTALWYHDHAMGVTRFNVYAGLFGFWIIRGQIEYELIKNKILPGEEDELYLVIQDRNFDTDAEGRLTGDLLHKTEQSTAEMFGPYTLVNGTLWPRCSVGDRPVRLRLLNGSNARAYCLRLVEVKENGDYGEDLTQKVPIYQIGTDGGLLDFPVKLPDLGLVLAPAERADVVIDFTGFSDKKLAFVNTAFAPFDGTTVTSAGNGTSNPIAPDPSNRLPFLHVLRFDVRPHEHVEPSVLNEKTRLDHNFVRYVHSAGDAQGRKELVLGKHNHRWIALTENPTGNLLFRELQEVTTDEKVAKATDSPLIAIQTSTTEITWYRTVAMHFHDTINILIPYDSWEIWNIINLTGDTHPIHLHLVEFQALHRQPYNIDGYVNEGGFTLPGKPIALNGAPVSPDSNEQGFKDTIRVNPNESLSIAAHFKGYCGRYMYHCHVLEHEDHDMMRPFVVVPAKVLALMDEGMGGMAM
ncbi:multicopper oxidase domain-containing protein [Aetokthonos hydrillicola Thurmond2011]|jgi:spore coat protein A|uniref:Multicopper oxidase domain-containing protein n=1 Tax=Aetokthonos hydrillicola Thurmond2011 TaxID=2712845 RepID=A0AAP5MAX0_9CYAN|nr:multicopper oxidase domain-containing protein [Aetokthonos hydrillicola]MBO3458779.1 multicopper oxidase domain-containing protein [Aetokthonos hydrillicola CCALA 1050]MBW4585526.1 multicopper oxidase domain-containing protein [Aetokthonos hydrillicola CCALA 1050]MDR9896149.1 multicopper oxidase domain-containing protein [Aetokthonos hydrillicola Thurmond2011]